MLAVSKLNVLLAVLSFWPYIIPFNKDKKDYHDPGKMKTKFASVLFIYCKYD